MTFVVGELFAEQLTGLDESRGHGLVVCARRGHRGFSLNVVFGPDRSL